MKFSIKEMTEALTNIGYKVVEEKELHSYRGYHDQVEEEEVDVINVYLHGEKMAIWLGAGTKRLEYVFSVELHKKMLGLFRVR